MAALHASAALYLTQALLISAAISHRLFKPRIVVVGVVVVFVVVVLNVEQVFDRFLLID